jgi:hypothetical protein
LKFFPPTKNSIFNDGKRNYFGGEKMGAYLRKWVETRQGILKVKVRLGKGGKVFFISS